jgi:hypothetical protein
MYAVVRDTEGFALGFDLPRMAEAIYLGGTLEMRIFQIRAT